MSELFAAALQDHGRAAVVGTRTRGHGRAHTLVMLHSPRGAAEGAVRMTDGRFLRPRGEPIEERGVVPDRPVADGGGSADLAAYLDRAVEYAIEIRRAPRRAAFEP